MSAYVQALGLLLTGAHCGTSHRAAGHLVAAQVVKSAPIDEPAACDAQMRELYPATGLEVLLRAPMVQYV